MHSKIRMQLNVMLSEVPDIKHVVGIREMVLPFIWFESVSILVLNSCQKMEIL